MRIYTNVSLVFLITEWTPNCFKMEHIKICILFHIFENINRKLPFVMSKCAHISVITTFNFVRIRLTKLCFVLLRMVKVLHSIVRSYTLIFIPTISFSSDILTNFRNIVYWGSATVFVITIVVVKTLFLIMSLKNSARLRFKLHQV